MRKAAENSMLADLGPAQLRIFFNFLVSGSRERLPHGYFNFEQVSLLIESFDPLDLLKTKQIYHFYSHQKGYYFLEVTTKVQHHSTNISISS